MAVAPYLPVHLTEIHGNDEDWPLAKQLAREYTQKLAALIV